MKATMDPNTTRYANASTDDVCTPVSRTDSPRAKPSAARAMAPPSISTTVVTSGSAGSDTRLAVHDPSAHSTLLAMTRSTAPSRTPSGRAPGSSSTARPTKPSRTPTTVIGVGQSRPLARSTTTHSGTPATSSAASPDGRWACSASVTPPLPPHSSSPPIATALTSCRGVDRKTATPRRSSRNTVTSTAATRKRALAVSSPGRLSTTYRIARYVEPHTT